MLQVSLVRGDRSLFTGSATQVVLPSASGEVAVLTCHAPMLCALMNGEVQIDEARFPVRGGIARVERDMVVILSH